MGVAAPMRPSLADKSVRAADNFVKINSALAGELDMEPEPPDVKTGEGFVRTFQPYVGIIQFHLSPPELPNFSETACGERRLPLRNRY